MAFIRGTQRKGCRRGPGDCGDPVPPGVEHWGRCSDPRVAAGALVGQAGGLMPRAAPASFENLEVGKRAALDAAGEEGRVVASSSLYLAGATRAQFSDLYLKQRGCWKPFPEQ